ncbi:MAG: efflux RND transporter periplasmic adaptor subunit [Chthoniobacterales bacterium]
MPTKRTKRFQQWTLACGAAGLLLAVTGCDKNAGAQGPPQMPPQDVGIVTLKSQRVEIFTELPGRTAAFRVAEVRPQVGGIVLKRLFKEGADVKEGEQLYQIDPARYQTAFDSAKAGVARDEAAAAVAKLSADRRSKLVTTSVISKQDYDDVMATWKQAVANVAVAKANLEKARIDLDYTKVLSPISGRIGRSAVTEGALVTPGQNNPLATVYQLDPIYVDMTQSSAQILKLRRELERGNIKGVEGQDANTKLILEDGTTYAYPGKLQFSEVSVDEGTGSVALRAVFPNPDQTLLPGMFVRATIANGVNESGILVPQRAVTRNARGEAVVLTVNTEDIVEMKVIETDRTIGGDWLVTKGLSAGDRVIVEGLQKAPPGSKVVPSEITAQEPEQGEK